MIPHKEIERLRDLAVQVRDIASDPIHSDNSHRWIKHNSLQSKEPMVLIYPEGSWEELIPAETLQTTNPYLRLAEQELLQRIYYYENLKDDNPIPGNAVINKMLAPFDWGLEEKQTHTGVKRGSYHLEPVLQDEDDLNKLRYPEVIYLEEETHQFCSILEEIVGDILPVQLNGIQNISIHMASQYNQLRGVDNFLTDFYLNPSLFHGAMEIFTEGWQRILKTFERENLLALNNDITYHNSGGNGFIDRDVPQDDFNPDHVRLKDMWGSAESQEFASVGPEHHWEFALQYEIKILENFGLNGYGCCEDLTRKMDYVKKIPHIRRISCSPWADIPECARQLKGDYILSWKPDPSVLVGNFDEKSLRSTIKEGLIACKEHGAVPELILKDIHTCEHKPERIVRWREIVREEIASVYS